MVSDITAKMNFSAGLAHHIIHDVLIFKRVCARWVRKHLTSEMKEKRRDMCRELFRQYEAKGEAFLHRIVTGDKSWVHFYESERNRASME